MTRFALLFFAAISGSVAVAQNGVPILVLADGPDGVEKANKAVALIDGTEWSETIAQSGLTMHVLFKDPDNTGFRDATLGEKRRARLYDALCYVAKILNTGGELNVMIGFSESDGTGPLAQAGPMFTSVNGIINGSVFQRLNSGTIPFPDYAEMSLTFDWGYAWNLSADAPPSDTLDLWSVAVHEITHCLGFISLMKGDGTSRFLPGSNSYTVYDSLLAKKSPLKFLLGGTTTDPVFMGGTADLTGGAVVFAGSEATAALGASPPICSSSPFLQGTSLQHWLENAIPGGAVMQPRYAFGVARRYYTDADVAVLRDIGWVAAEVPEQELCGLQSVAIVEPSQSTIAAEASGSALVQFRATVTVDTSNPFCEDAGGVLRVEYFVDGVSRGASGDQEGHFPLNTALGTGIHTVRASASRTDSSEGPIEAEKTFSISTTVLASPKISVTPAETPQAFGAVNTGAFADATYTVRNAGTGTLTGAASLAGGAEFQFVGASTYSLSPGASKKVTVRFTPGKRGGCAATLSFDGNGGNVTLALTGSGVKTGGVFNCAGGRETPGVDTADLMVGVLAAMLLLSVRGRADRQQG